LAAEEDMAAFSMEVAESTFYFPWGVKVILGVYFVFDSMSADT
jgi:hypothetical protein